MAESVSPKQGSTTYTAAARANAAANAGKYEWARKSIEAAVEAAGPWVETDDEALWRMVISPKLKRAIMVNVNKGCPNCGMAMYGELGPRPYAWLGSVEGNPWKVQCPNCKELFPKNDFGKFYESAIDPKTGLYDPALGDRGLLFNTDHPDPNDPLHTKWIDDGDGHVRDSADLVERDFFIAYHAYAGRCRRMGAAIVSLANAYALTSKPIYAHKCAVLLDRLADVYPDYDGANEQLFNNVWGRYSDGILGPNYWEGGSWTQRAIDYDKVFDGIGEMPETLAFIQAKAREFQVPRRKDSIADVRASIEDRILIDPQNHHNKIWMNGTVTEMCIAKVDLILRGRAALNDFVTRHMPAIAPPEHLNDDGSGNERSTGYDSGAFGQFCQLLEELAAMDRRVAQAALDGYPRFRACFDFWPDIWCLEQFIPQIGDTGEPGATSGLQGSPGAYLALFDLTGEARYAQIALRIAGDPEKLPRNIFAEDPEALVERAVRAAEAAGPWRTPSVVKRDYGLGILRSGRGDGQHALWFYYSPKPGTSSHSHFDALTLGLYAFGQSLICEQGYPLYTGGWPARWAWTSNTRSHATVIVNDDCQKHCDAGRLLTFHGAHGVQVVAAETPCVYDGVSRYRRTIVAMEVSPDHTFYVDVFRVRGGRSHNYTIPMFYGESTADGLTLEPHADLYDGYVTHVRSAPAAADWFIDTATRAEWKGEPAAHLRVHGGASDATVMLAQGESRWGRDDPRRLPYLIVRREAGDANLDSTFVTVIEAYRDKPFLDVHPLSAESGPDKVEIAVTLAGKQRVCRLAIHDEAQDRVIVRVNAPLGDGVEPFALGETKKVSG